MEPFQKPSQIEEYKSKLGFDNAIANYSGKIWYFWRREWTAEVILDSIH